MSEGFPQRIPFLLAQASCYGIAYLGTKGQDSHPAENGRMG
jgi:hypothetical protein